MFVPTIFENNNNGCIQTDMFSRLFMDRIILIMGEITSEMSVSVCTQLLYLSSHAKDETVYIYINSPGGEVVAGMAIYDTMKYVKNTICTICFGLAASMGSLLLSSGDKGMRFALPHSQIVLHQPLGGISGQASDIAIHAKNILETKEMITDIFVENTGIDKGKMEGMLDRDFIINAKDGVSLGVIDGILHRQELLGKQQE